MSLKRERAKLLKALEEKRAKLEQEGCLPVKVTRIEIPNVSSSEMFRMPRELMQPNVLEKQRRARKAKRGE